MRDSIVIVGSARTPVGAFNGQFKHCPASMLGASAVAQAVASLPIEHVRELVMGCVLPAGQGQAPARQVGAKAGLPLACPAVTVNKVCGSGIKSIEMAIQALSYHQDGIYVAGGMENMSLAPHLLPKSREGFRLGDVTMQDHLFVDGLIDASEGLAMGVYAEKTAEAYGFTREDQDAFAVASLKSAQLAVRCELTRSEIAGVVAPGHKDPFRHDEIPGKLSVEKIPRLKPAFAKNGSVTAANASSLADGAAALALTTESLAKAHGYTVLAKIRSITTHSQSPATFTSAPVPAIQKLLKSENLSVSDIDIWEINEAFAVVPMVAIKELNIDRDRVNPDGGACALGHPLGATGTRILVSLLGGMERKGHQLGVAALCIGGGEGMAVLVERT